MNPRYIAETTKSPAQAVTDLEASVKQHGYGVLHTYDLKQTLASKGFDLPRKLQHFMTLQSSNTKRWKMVKANSQ